MSINQFMPQPTSYRESDPFWDNVKYLIRSIGTTQGQTGSGIVKDFSKNNYVPTTISNSIYCDFNNPSFGAEPSLRFQGANNGYIDFQPIQFIGDFTVEFRFSSNQFTNGIISSPQSGGLLVQKTNLQRLGLYRAGIATINETAIPNWVSDQTTFFNIAICREGNTIKYFSNGVLFSTFTSSATFTLGSLRIGTGYGGDNFTGSIDEIRITLGVSRYSASYPNPTKRFPIG